MAAFTDMKVRCVIVCDGLNRIYCSWYFALQVLRGDPWQEIPRQGFISTSVCKIAAALVAAVEAAFALGADTLLAKMAGLTACFHDRNNGVVL